MAKIDRKKVDRARVTFDPDEPWVRARREPESAFQAFEIFRNLAGRRALKSVADKSLKSLATVYQWSGTYKWKERVEAWDRRQAAEGDKVRLEFVRKSAEVALRGTVRAMELTIRAFSEEKATDADHRALALSWNSLVKTFQDLTDSGPTARHEIVGADLTEAMRGADAPDRLSAAFARLRALRAASG